MYGRSEILGKTDRHVLYTAECECRQTQEEGYSGEKAKRGDGDGVYEVTATPTTLKASLTTRR